jgi:hypothetical protein
MRWPAWHAIGSSNTSPQQKCGQNEFKRRASSGGSFYADPKNEGEVMALKLNDRAFEHAKQLIKKGDFVADERDDWSEHQPSVEEENEFIRRHGFEEYGKWHLGINDEHGKETKGHYEFPHGDFKNVHRCAVISAESRAGQYKHYDIEKAAHRLHEMIDAQKEAHAKS